MPQEPEFDFRFTAEESRELLLFIFPEYPGIRSPNPVPDLAEFLKQIRAKAE